MASEMLDSKTCEVVEKQGISQEKVSDNGCVAQELKNDSLIRYDKKTEKRSGRGDEVKR